MQNLQTIWERPVYLSEVQPPLTNQAIQETEIAIGYRLPVAYTKLLETQNGGSIRCALEHLPCHLAIFGIGPNEESITNNFYLKFIPEGLIPFDGDGDFCLCMDYRNNPDNPAITALHGSCDEQVFYVEREQPIAGSFKEYLDMLEVHTKDTAVFETDMGIKAAISVISTIAQKEFRSADIYGGIIRYVSQVHFGDGCLTIEVYNNIVPKHYTYRDATEKEYERDPVRIRKVVMDKNYPQEYALVHPEVPAEFILLHLPCHCKEVPGFIEKMRAAGHVVRRLKEYFD